MTAYVNLLCDIFVPDSATNGHVQPWQVFWGASTGASFYILMQSYGYLTDRSFDPKYNAAYLTRFVCGLVAGFILAQVSGMYVDPSGQWGKVGPGIFALLGGFAAEAVEQLLKRMVDVFLALVKGGSDSDTASKLQAQKTQLTSAQSQRDADLRKILTSIPVDGFTDDSKKAMQDALARLT